MVGCCESATAVCRTSPRCTNAVRHANCSRACARCCSLAGRLDSFLCVGSAVFSPDSDVSDACGVREDRGSSPCARSSNSVKPPWLKTRESPVSLQHSRLMICASAVGSSCTSSTVPPRNAVATLETRTAQQTMECTNRQINVRSVSRHDSV